MHQHCQRPNESVQLYLMNWLGFGKNSKDDDNRNDGANVSTIVSSSDASSTVLLSSSSSSSLKEYPGKNSNSGSRSAGSGVVAIMDSMDQLKRSQRIGKITATLVQELKSITVEGSSENGKIKIIMDGQQNPISTYIDESYFREQQQPPRNNNNNNVDTNELSKAITTAMKDARMKSIEKMNEKMKNVYNELGFYNTSS
jgi:DNA-binding protein YbaB